MSATPPQVQGTEAPSQIEFLWERYRRLIQVIVGAVLAGLLINYGLQYMERSKIDAKWSKFAANMAIDVTYEDAKNATESLSDAVSSLSPQDIDAAVAAADAAQKPFALLAKARHAMHAKTWDRAEAALTELEKDFPDHPLVLSSPYPVQVRDEIKRDENDIETSQGRKPEYKPAKEGSTVTLLRAQIAAARGFEAPAHFARIEPPADAAKVKITLTGDRSFVIALMDQAPLTKAKFLELARSKFWEGLHVDEIQRPAEGMGRDLPRQMHLGYETTRDLDRTKWTTTDPSTNTVEFEASGLSHFPGAVAARIDADGKSAVDRFFIVADDASRNDGDRVVFGYVVEGLDVIKAICEESMQTSEEEEAGRGKPSSNLAVESVEVL